jgi:glutamyl-tRNA synthetase
MRTRLAPTPSGYLHVGNAVNFLVVHMLAGRNGADVLLRIDDLDTPRVRPEFLEDIFRVLEWLGIHWQVGPGSLTEVPDWSQQRRMTDYSRALDTLVDHPSDFYVCSCSRTKLRSHECECASASLELVSGVTCVRMRTPTGDAPVIWRREGLPSYHLASVVDDDLFDVDLVVRGEDLRPASDLQRRLAEFLPGNTFPRASLVHHPLLTDGDGMKLSKSAGAGARPLHLTAELRHDIERQAVSLVADCDTG